MTLLRHTGREASLLFSECSLALAHRLHLQRQTCVLLCLLAFFNNKHTNINEISNTESQSYITLGLPCTTDADIGVACGGCSS